MEARVVIVIGAQLTGLISVNQYWLFEMQLGFLLTIELIIFQASVQMQNDFHSSPFLWYHKN